MAEDAGDLVELAKRRGFFLPAAGAYGGVAGFYTYGPAGAALKDNVEAAFHDRFTVQEGHMQIDAPTILPEPVFEASGHLEGFDDMIVDCPDCGASHRADHVVEDATDYEEAEGLGADRVEEIIASYELVCPACGAGLAGQAVDAFNLMFETSIGPGDADPGYLRPETAQGIFVEFPQLAEYARNQLPFGVTQVGRAYRNEISPRKSLLRVREFTQAELELFVDPERDEPDLDSVAGVTAPFYPVDAQEADDGAPVERSVAAVVEDGTVAEPWIAYYLGVAAEYYDRIGVDMERFRFRQHLAGERAHYAADCWDAEANVGTADDPDWIELGGFAYRSDYDLRKHAEHSNDDFTVFRQYDEPVTREQATVDPDMSVLGPEFGGDAGAVADALEALAESDAERLRAGESAGADDGTTDEDDGGDDDDHVTVTVDGTEYDVPHSAVNFAVEEVTEAGEHVRPHVVEPSLGVDRAVYTVLEHNHRTDQVDGEERTVLSVPPAVAPTDVGVFPLMDRDGLGERASTLVDDLRAAGLSVTYDESGAIGRRYRRQDEVGTPYCVTVDYVTLGDSEDGDGEPGTVTVRERDSTDQVRVPAEELPATLSALLAGDREFEDL